MSRWHAKTTDEVAEFLGLSDRRSVQAYFAKGCPSEKTKDGYDLQAIMLWVKANVWCKSGKDSGRLEEAEIRKAEADATLKETKVKQLIGQLISKVVVIAALSKLFNEIRARLQAIPGELASSIPPELRTDLTLDLETKINLILTGMAAWSKSWNVTMESQTRGPKRSTSRQSGRVAKRSRQGSGRSGSRGAKKTS